MKTIRTIVFILTVSSFSVSSIKADETYNFQGVVSRTQNEISLLLEEVKQAMEKARTAKAHILAPSNFGQGMKLYQTAETEFKKGADVKGIQQKLRNSLTYFDKALETTKLARTTLAASIQARSDAQKAEASKYVPTQYYQANKKFSEAVDFIEAGNMDQANSSSKEAENLFRKAEQNSLKLSYEATNPPPALEGGRGFINTQTASTYGKGYLGFNINSIYNPKKIKGQASTEHLFVGATSLTFDMTDDVELSAVLYVIGQGLLYSDKKIPDKTESGFGNARVAVKLHMPLSTTSVDLGARVAMQFPVGTNFAIHPSFPYDTEVFGIELMALQSFNFSSKFRMHLNEGFRWQGLRKEYVGKEDLVLNNLAFDYTLGRSWRGYSEIASAVEIDDKIDFLEDRLIYTQGFQYLTSWNFGVNLSGNFRLNKERTDGTPTRAENWRVLLGLSFHTRPFQKDDDEDGVANVLDLEPNTPSGWPVDSRGRALDSDNDGVADGIDQEPNTRIGALVDKFGRSIDTDGDGIPDGIDKEPNTPQGAIVNVRGFALDTDGDGVLDGIDQEPNTPKSARVDVRGVALDTDGDGVLDGIDQEPNTVKGAIVDAKGVALDTDGDGVPDGIDEEPGTPKGVKVDLKGRALPPMEIELITKGLLRVHKIYFDVGKSTIKPESYAALNEIGRILEKYPDLKIQINGHTDATGSDDFNYRLSVQRANAVRDYLVSRFSDINANNLTTWGFGRSRPISDDRSEAGRTQNRRVEFEVLNLEQLKAMERR